MSIKAPPMTAEEFEEFALLPQNVDRRLELIGGEVVELVSNQKSGCIALKIGHLTMTYLDQNPIGYATPPNSGYRVGADRYQPDIAFVSKARQPVRSDETYNPLAPDLAVEVMSPSDETGDVVAKTNNYILAGQGCGSFIPNGKRSSLCPGPTHQETRHRRCTRRRRGSARFHGKSARCLRG